MEPNISHNNVICIYCITNTVNGKKYIGKTKNLYKRIHQYLYDVKHNRKNSINNHFLNAFNNYGIENFKYEVLESFDELNEDLIKEKELYWMDQYNTIDPDNGYNLRRDSKTNMIVHPKTSEKISERLKKEWDKGLRDDHSEKLSQYWQNNSSRKKEQSKVMKRALTKYLYIIYDNNSNPICFCYYKQLKERNLQNVNNKFKYHNKNKVPFKNVIIERFKVEDIVQTS